MRQMRCLSPAPSKCVNLRPTGAAGGGQGRPRWDMPTPPPGALGIETVAWTVRQFLPAGIELGEGLTVRYGGDRLAEPIDRTGHWC